MESGALWIADNFSIVAVAAFFAVAASLCCGIHYQAKEPRRIKLGKMQAKRNQVRPQRSNSRAIRTGRKVAASNLPQLLNCRFEAATFAADSDGYPTT